MGILGNVAPIAGGLIGGALGGPQGAAVGASLGSSFGAKGRMKEGYDIENAAALERRAMEWNFADKKLGLTPQEFYGAPAAGGAPSGSGAQVLGNQAQQQAQQLAQMAYESDQKDKDRATAERGQDVQLATAELQSQSQIASSSIAANANILGSQLNAQTAASRLDFDKSTQERVTIPKLAAELEISEAELQKRLNEVANSDPEYVRQLNSARLGVENSIQQVILSEYGVDLTQPETITKLDPEARVKLLLELFGAQGGKSVGDIGAKLGTSLMNYFGVPLTK